MGRNLARRARAVCLVAPLAFGGCATVDSLGVSSSPREGEPGYLTGFIGSVVADEPQAATVARDVLSAGGTAADAATALAFALGVTLPSRAGLGGGGACVVYSPNRPNDGVPEALLFVPPAPAKRAPEPVNGAIVPVDRPAAVPMLARGLFALQSRYGNRVFESLISPAERMARQGITAPRALVRDLAVVAGPLAADPAARAVFFPGGRPLAEGTPFLQPGLAATLGDLRQQGVGGFYQGVMARRIADAARDAGGGLSVADLRDALPKFAPALIESAGPARVAFPPPPADGGLAAAAAFAALYRDHAAPEAAGARALAVAARWRASGGDPATLLKSADVSGGGLPPLPASTSFAVVDRRGVAVACALTMNNLFGTGRFAAGTGMLLAASPAAQTPPLLSAAIAYDPDRDRLLAAVGGSGQAGAPLAVAATLRDALAAKPFAPPPDPGRANAIACPDGVPKGGDSCRFTTDPRGAGLAIGSGG